ncbi:MAG TPA: signal peptidase I [Candidatus Limnocylindria bacterium]
MGLLLTLAWRAIQVGLWIALLGFLALFALGRFTPYEALVVRSGSMAPTIATGSVTIVDRAAQTPEVGDIVSFRTADGSLVTHRVVGITDAGFLTRGDANPSNDWAPRPPRSVYGTVLVSLPVLGYFIHTLEQPAAFLLLLLGSGGLLVLGALQTIYQEVMRLSGRREVTDAD